MTTTEDVLRAVDNSDWDGNAAMTNATSAADYRSICAGKTNGDPSLRSTWKLPHHKSAGGPPNAAGVRAALQRLSQTQGIDQAAARRHLEAHMAEIRGQRAASAADAPKEVVRARGEIGVREPDGDGTIGTVFGFLARFGEWTEVDSMIEGHFLESVRAGTFVDTIRRDRGRYQPLYEHGRDPVVARKPLGPIRVLDEREGGAYYEVGMLDTDYNRSILPAIQHGLMGSSFRGDVMADEVDAWPDPTPDNPQGLDMRTITRMKLTDFGPCPFPQYEGATAAARSMMDEYLMGAFAHGEGLQRLAEFAKQSRPIVVRSEDPEPEPDPEPDDGDEQDTGSDDPTPDEQSDDGKPRADTDADTDGEPPEDTAGDDSPEGGDMQTENTYRSREELLERVGVIDQRFQEIARDHPAGGFTDTERSEFEDLKAEKDQLLRWRDEFDEIERTVKDAAAGAKPGRADNGVGSFHTTRTVERDIYDPTARWAESRNPADVKRLLDDDARRAVERGRFPQAEDTDDAKHRVMRLLDTVADPNRTVAERILATGSPLYKRAFGKALAHVPLTSDEADALARPIELERALSLTGASGGFAVPFELDPTILGTSNGTVNPLRRIARVESISVDEWRGVSSAGITAAYAAEATETTDNAPTLVQPTISTEKAQAFVPFSIEIGQDWDSLQTEMARLLQAAKDDLEADKFVNGTGTNEPFGLLTGVTNTVNAGAGGTFTIAHLYALIEALPPRYQPNAQFAATLAIYNKIRQFDTQGGAGLWMYLREGIGVQQGGNTGAVLVDRPANIASAMPTATTTGLKFLVFGDFSRFVIVDRVGLNVETIQHLVGTNHRPTGQRGLYAYWRNSSKVVDANAFRALLGVA